MKIKIGKYPKKGNRKVNVEIESFDTWSMDNTLANIILPMLVQLKESKHGYPAELCSWHEQEISPQHCFDFYEETKYDDGDEGLRRWNEIIDKMIWSFQQLVVENYDDKYHHGKAEYSWKKSEKADFHNPITNKLEHTYQMIDENPDEHWYDVTGHQLHDARINEGLELFGKYYRSLWD